MQNIVEWNSYKVERAHNHTSNPKSNDVSVAIVTCVDGDPAAQDDSPAL